MISTRTEFPFPVRVDENFFITLPDGTRLAAKGWFPEGAGPVPVVLEYLPYRKRDGTRTRDQGLHGWLAGHGYACIRLDIRGTGDSEGLITGEYTPQELQDGTDAIAWLARQDWCDGQVAMIGISWGGFNGLQIAALQPPALKTIITLGSTDDRYATDIHWIGGCLSKDNFDWSATMFAQNDLPPDPELVGPGWRQMWQERIEANRPWILDWLRHQRRDDYWKQGSVCEDFTRITIPVYAVSGWADNYSEAIPRLLAGLGGPRLGLIGPWAHSWPYDVSVEPGIGWLDEALRWLDHWLKAKDTGIMDEPMLRAWMQDSVPPRTCYGERPGRWVGEAVWPSPRITETILHLDQTGRLGNRTGSGEASVCSPLWVGLGAGEIGRYGADADWPGDQREDDGGSLVFTTAPLDRRLEILGATHLQLRLKSNRPQALIAARLTDIAPDGSSTRVCLGLLNLTHRDSHESATERAPGQWYDCSVELDDIAHSFPPGHRIGLSLSTTYWPVAWPSPELATLTLALGQCRLSLPVRPEDPADTALRPFGPPEMAAQSPQENHAPHAPPRRTVTRDLLSGEMIVNFPRWTYAVTFPDIAQTVTSTAHARFTITDGNPQSARCDTAYDVEIKRPDGRFGHRSTGTMTCDASQFHINVTLEVTENDKVIFARAWNESFARDMV
jgi:uncharacterized protein